MRVRAHEEMFLDVDKNGQFIPGIAPPREDGKTFRQIFEESIIKGLDKLTEISYYRLGQSVLEVTKDLISGRDSVKEQEFFDKLCSIVKNACFLAMYDLPARILPDGERMCYVGEFPQPYYENADHIKVDENGRRYSTAMDVFYMLAIEVSDKDVWSTGGEYIEKEIAEKQDYLKESKPGFFAGKKKREYYEREKARTEQKIQELKREYISCGNVDSDLFEIRLIRLWVLNAGRADTKEDQKIRKRLLEWLDHHEKRLLAWVDSITTTERELGIENNSFSPVESKA